MTFATKKMTVSDARSMPMESKTGAFVDDQVGFRH
jgi:hypothetical protein